MKMPAKIWSILFLALTVIPIAMELVAGLDKNRNTVPWTYFISHYIPWPIALAAYTALAVWLPVHFRYWYTHHYVPMLDNASKYEALLRDVPLSVVTGEGPDQAPRFKDVLGEFIRPGSYDKGKTMDRSVDFDTDN